VEAHGVLTTAGAHDSLFCSPWLRAVGNDPSQQRALDELKASLQQRAASHLIKIRLRRGDLLIIDNGRILHGRGELRSDSKRELLRAWIRRRA
jgi:alpha-ketoglutarate-dependent taurine dioxygenase